MKKESQKKNKKKFPWGLLGFVGAAGLALYVAALDMQIRKKFESHRWNLPSRIYSDAYALYPGRVVSAAELETRLERLGYKKRPTAPKTVGEYSRGGDQISVFLHSFSYPSGDMDGFPIQIRFEGSILSAIQRLDTQEDVKTVKLEPELIASLFDEKMEDRTLVSMTDIPEALLNGVVAVEDERFYSHHGIDPIGLARALLVDLVHLKAVQGGSTLTQQLVKNYFLTSKKTFGRKINEMIMALILEARYTKEEILEAYLNEIYFGQRGAVSVTGVEEAAKMFFSKSVNQLSIAECALIAGVIRSPGEYSPFRNINKAYDRRNFVLKMMWSQEMIDDAEYAEAKKEKIVLSPVHTHFLRAPYFVDFIQSQLKTDYSTDVLKSEGLRIFTTLDPLAQEAAEESLTKHLTKLENEKPRLKKNREEGKPLEGVFIAVQPQTGAIRAFVGGRDYETSQFNRVTDAHRQPGSAFKPFVYLTALNQGEKTYTLASTLEDASFTVRSGDKNWSPENYDKQEHGTVTLREALEQSMNIATTRLALDVGLERIIEVAHAAGIESGLDPVPSLALGAFEVTPLELVRAYTIFPNQGTRTEPVALMNVVTRDGVLLDKKNYQMKKVIAPEVAYLMNSLLRGVVDRGTASSSRTLGFTGLAAGKTGTTSDYKDSWFVGYTPDLLAVSWVGYDDNTSTGLSGASGPLPIWTGFMKSVNPPGALREDFPSAENIVLVSFERDGKDYEEPFIKGTEPN